MRLHLLKQRGRACALAMAMFFSSALCAQNVQITGTVSDASGMPLVGVSVVIRGTNNGTSTDAGGKYAISAPADGVMQFSSLGYVGVSENVNGRTEINVQMADDVTALDDVVVIGYGTMRKSDLTGSVTSVKSEDINRFPAGDVTEMLRGQAAGVQVLNSGSSSSSAPGGTSEILIRGNRSLSSSQSPLYIVDGMVVPHVSDLNSTDIASLEILKDASSQAIYGARASNGVILITTKKGNQGKVNVNVNAYLAVETFSRNFDFWTPEEWVRMRFWGKYLQGSTSVGTPDNMDIQAVIDDPVMYESYVNKEYTDWEKLMLTNAMQQKYDVNITGGTQKLRVAMGAGIYDQRGIVKSSGFTRGTYRVSLDYSPFKWLDISFKTSYAKSKTVSTDSNFSDIFIMPVLAKAYDEEGNLLRDISGITKINPLWRNREYSSDRFDDYYLTNFGITFKIAEGLSYRFSGNLRNSFRETGSYRTKLYPGSTGEGSLSEYVRQGYLFDNVINYEVPIRNSDHRLTATLIQSVDQDLQKTTGMSYINSSTDLFGYNVASDADINSVTRNITRSRTLSYAARVQYSLKERYLFTFSVRRDGASVFGPENKWGTFPSAAFAWRINEESFLKETNWIDMLKLRLSYGVVGNSAIPAYRTLGVSTKYEYQLGDQLAIGYFPGNDLTNAGLRWETTSSANVGVDFTAFRGRLNATLEAYRTDTEDLLIKRTIPSITGYKEMWDNLGKTRSWGYEATVNGTIIKKRDFEWNLGFNAAIQRNKIVSIDGRRDENGDLVDDIANNWYIGQSINVRKSYVAAGIWQTGEDPQPNEYLPTEAKPNPGDIKLLDYNGDGQITTDDRKIMNLDPKWFGSISTSVYYKGFDLNLEFYTVQGITKQNSYVYNYDDGGALRGTFNGMKMDYWTPENPSNTMPRPGFTSSVSNFPILGWQNASYFRLRLATLGYTLPKAWSQKIFMEKARIYCTATNVFTITDFQSYSPEKTSGSYPEPQVYTVGINLTF